MPPFLTLIRCETEPSPPGCAPTVLFAEPDRLRGALIVAGLEDLGLEVVWVPDGDSAIDAAAQTTFHVHVVEPSLRAAHSERVVEVLVTEHPRVPLVVTGSSASIIHLASTRIPPADVVDLVRAALGLPARAPQRWARTGAPRP